MTIRAIFENGVFRPIEPVRIPEHCPVLLHAEVDEKSIEQDRVDNGAIWGILASPVDAGDPRLSERHDGHQP